MKKTFITSSIILLVGGLLTKILGMIIKITIARKIGSEGLGLYMLILPTLLLFMNISQFGFPLSLSKLVSEDTRNNKKLYFSIFPILLIINIFLIGIIIFISPIISNHLLHNKNTYYSILVIAFVIPFTSISSICRSYFFGKNKMIPHVLSNITEDLVRLIIILFTLDKILPLGLPITVAYLVGINIISELSSTLILLLFLPKKISFKKEDFLPNKIYVRENLKIGIPSTSSRIISSIAYFFEPIILTTSLLNVGYSRSFILKEYGILSGYIIPLVLLSSYPVAAISQALLPILSKEYKNKNKKTITKSLTLAILSSLVISTMAIIILLLVPSLLLETIYHTQEGIPYLKYLAPIMIIQNLQYPLSITLDAFGKTKDNLKISLLSAFTRSMFLYFLSNLKIGLYSLILTIIINILLTTTYLGIKVKKHINNL